jgi:hypothetical protein
MITTDAEPNCSTWNNPDAEVTQEEPRPKSETLLLTCCSETYAPLGAVTMPNHQDYAARQGYDYECLQIDARGPRADTKSALFMLHAVLAALEDGYKTVLTHGIDVIFTNQTIKLADIEPRAAVVIAREELRWWPINFDVVIWRDDMRTIALLKRLIDEEPIWKKLRWWQQQHLWNLLQSDETVRKTVAIVPARTMNSTAQLCASRWQLGDFVCHFLDMPMPERIKCAKAILKIAGPCDGTYIKDCDESE